MDLGDAFIIEDVSDRIG
jgi:hypothetical protein